MIKFIRIYGKPLVVVKTGMGNYLTNAKMVSFTGSVVLFHPLIILKGKPLITWQSRKTLANRKNQKKPCVSVPLFLIRLQKRSWSVMPIIPFKWSIKHFVRSQVMKSRILLVKIQSFWAQDVMILNFIKRCGKYCRMKVIGKVKYGIVGKMEKFFLNGWLSLWSRIIIINYPIMFHFLVI